MKKTLLTITLAHFAIAITTTALAITYIPDDPNNPPTMEELERRRQLQEQARQRQERQNQNLEKAKAGDDDALNEYIIGIQPHFHGGFSYAIVAKELVDENGISRKRMVKVLDEIIHKNLPPGGDGYKVHISMSMLEGLPSDDTLALFEKYATLVKNSSTVTRCYNNVKEEVRRQRLCEKAKEGDDNALKEHITAVCLDANNISITGRNDYMKWLVNEFPRRRVMKMLDEIFRKSFQYFLTVKEKEPKNGEVYNDAFYTLWYLMQMLEGLPGEDTLALLKEYTKLEDDHVSNQARHYHNEMEKEMRRREEQKQQKQKEPPTEQPPKETL